MDFYFALLLSRRVAKSKCHAKWKNCYVILINGEGTYFVSFFSAHLSFSFLYPFPAMSPTLPKGVYLVYCLSFKALGKNPCLKIR